MLAQKRKGAYLIPRKPQNYNCSPFGPSKTQMVERVNGYQAQEGLFFFSLFFFFFLWEISVYPFALDAHPPSALPFFSKTTKKLTARATEFNLHFHDTNKFLFFSLNLILRDREKRSICNGYGETVFLFKMLILFRWC